MDQSISRKISLLNQTALDSLREMSDQAIIQRFTEVAIRILGGDFGFAWSKTKNSEAYQLVYKSKGMPYKPKLPREHGGNFQAEKNKSPVFVEQVIRKNYEKKYDVSSYMKSYVIIPILYKNNLYGSIVICFKKEHIFIPEDKELSTSLGHTTAQTMTIRHLIEKERDAHITSERNEAYFKALVENSHEVIMLVNRTGKILYVSQSAVYIYKIDVGNMIGKNIADFVYNGDKQEIAKYIRKIARGFLDRTIVEFSYKHTDGSILSLESVAFNMIDNPHVGGIVLNIRDITLQKKTEILKETERLLQEEKLKTEFIANATHEIRTPLAIIRGNVDLALMENMRTTKSIRSVFHTINHEIEHLSDMISDLTLLTSDNGVIKRKMPFEKVNFTSILSHTVKTLDVIAIKKNISIKFKKNKNVYMMGNATYLEKVCTNLIKNAITYGKEGGWIKVEYHTIKGNVVMVISDNGIGIGTSDTSNVFSRFYRTEHARKHSSSGIGLGLPIAKWVVEIHGGTISLNSTEGEGSAFTVSMPILK